jgi:hypothetical protein
MDLRNGSAGSSVTDLSVQGLVSSEHHAKERTMMNIKRVGYLCLGMTIATMAGYVPAAMAHESDAPAPALNGPLPPATLVQLEEVRRATARFADVAQAEKEGYVDINLPIPQMGRHFLKPGLLDATFDPSQPELLVYADDPCGGKVRLVAVEYAVPLSLSKNAPQGFVGPADRWSVNKDFQLWTLHAWVFEYNTAGVFTASNARVP